MTPNWAASVVNTLLLAFFVTALIGIGFLVYAAKQMKAAEPKKAESKDE